MADKKGKQHNYKIGDKVLCKVKGFPAWPGRNVEPDNAPKNVLKDRPKSKTHLVRFFGDPQYSWAVIRDLSPLTDEDIEKFINSPSKAKGNLMAAYKIALKPEQWEADMEQNQEDADQLEDDDEEEEEEEEEEESTKTKAAKRKRKPAAEKKALAESKRRKTDEKPKPGRRKSTINTEPVSEDEPVQENADAKNSKSQKSSKDVSKTSKEAADPNFKTVREWRNRLQKAFLSTAMVPPEDMPMYDEIFKTIEAFPMQHEWCRETKLIKVMKKISELTTIPRHEEFKIKERAHKLAEKWRSEAEQALQAADPAAYANLTASNANESMAIDGPASNGAENTADASGKKDAAAAITEQGSKSEENKPIEDTNVAATNIAAAATNGSTENAVNGKGGEVPAS